MLETSREIVLLINGKARMGDRIGDETRAALEQEGFQVRDYLLTKSKDEFDRALKRHLDEQAPLIGIGGGDGTQRMAAEKIAGTSSCMAVLPLGTGNAWAGDLGVPTGAVPTAQALAKATPKSIDLGIANGHGFVNVTTLGLTSLIVRYLPKDVKSRFGKLAYLPAVIRSLRDLRSFELEVKTDKEIYRGRALVFVAAAGRTHAGPLRVTRKSSHDDGRLSVYALDNTDGKGMLKFGVGLLLGMHTELSEVWACETSAAEVITTPAKRLIIDGEPTGRTPLSLSVKSKSLKVLVPNSED